MAATILLNIYGHRIPCSNARGRFMTGTIFSDGSLHLDDSRTSSPAKAVKAAGEHGDNGFLHDTHTGRSITVAELRDIS